MGALRASELDSYGMVGVGRIYQWYRDGVLEADDEVAVTTNPETFEPVSDPLVNIRETFNDALYSGLINDVVHGILLDIAKKTHYSQRSYFGIIKQAVREDVISSEEGDELLRYCREGESDVKREDAILVLEKIKQMLEN